MASTLVESVRSAPAAVGAQPGVLARLGLLRDLDHPRQAFSYLTPNWFASVMGTGIVAVAAHSLPWHPPGLAELAAAFWVLAVVLFTVLAAVTPVHWVNQVSAFTGALLVPYASPGLARTSLLLACYAMFTASLVASAYVISRIVGQLARADIGEAWLVPTVWIVHRGPPRAAAGVCPRGA